MKMKKELISYIANGIAVKFGEAVRTMKFQPEGEFGRRQLAKGEPTEPTTSADEALEAALNEYYEAVDAPRSDYDSGQWMREHNEAKAAAIDALENYEDEADPGSDVIDRLNKAIQDPGLSGRPGSGSRATLDEAIGSARESTTGGDDPDRDLGTDAEGGAARPEDDPNWEPDEAQGPLHEGTPDEILERETVEAERFDPSAGDDPEPSSGRDEDLSPDVSEDAYDRAAKAVEAEDKGFVDPQHKAEGYDKYGPQTQAEVAAADERLAAAMDASRPFGLDDLDRDERLDRHQELIDAYLEAHDDSPLASDAGQMIDAIKQEEYLERAALGEEANPASEESLKAGEELKEIWSGDDYAAAAEASRERKGYSSSEEARQRTPGVEVSEEAEAAYAAAKEANKAYGETWQRWDAGEATDEETLAALENAEVADQKAQALGAPMVSSMEPMTPGGQDAKVEREDASAEAAAQEAMDRGEAPDRSGGEATRAAMEEQREYEEGGGGRTDRCPDGTHKNKKSGNCEPFRLTGDLQMYIANGIAMRFGKMANKFLRTKK